MKKIILLGLCLLISAAAFAQNTTADAGLKVPEDRNRNSSEGFASEEFRLGVQAYYKGAFNEAILLFERSLSYLPNDNLILEWLGKAYYKSGLEGSALSAWEEAGANGYGGLLLENKIEIVKERRITGDSTEKAMRLTEAGSFMGDFNGEKVFEGPVSVLPNKDGTLWITSYNSNELVLFNQNGQVIERRTGPLNGFDRPYDMLRLSNGKIVVSEHAGDRLSLLGSNGQFEKYIGERGRNNGQLVGPLYLTEDTEKRIYVSDYGNRRIDVFTEDGEPLFFFGGKKAGFAGLKGPTGVCALNDSIFVADDQTGAIYEFDKAGNFIRKLSEKETFKHPEAIRVWNKQLVICDQNKIIGVDPDTGALFEYVRTGNAPTRVVAASPDVNGNVVAADFIANEVYVMSGIQELVGGLFVQIEQIDASAFPNVVMEVKVENRHRQPVVGLQESNFYVSENKRPVTNLKFLGASSNNKDADITLIIDRSNESKTYAEEIETAVKEIASGMSDSATLRIVSAAEIPVTEYHGKKEGVKDFTLSALKTKNTDVVNVDLAVRLAANDLINAAKKRAIIFISGGDSSAYSFEKYNLPELTSYLCNNSIGFSVIQVNMEAVNSEINYMVENTPGDVYYVFRPEGLKNIIQDIVDQPQGVYQLSFTSSLATNFGEKYLPLEAEVYLLNRSGRDETGYFAPLQ